MDIIIERSKLEQLLNLRASFLQENQFQFTYNKCHDYGWADYWIIKHSKDTIGYGCVWGTNNRADRDSIFEFYLESSWRANAHLIFPDFCKACAASWIECQSNDFLLTSMLFMFCESVQAEAILFEDKQTTNMKVADAIFRQRKDTDNLGEDDSTHVVELSGNIVGTGGYLLNYNFPYADIYMQILEPYRGRGLGSWLVQELKKEVYESGRVPAARCNVNNMVSKSTLQRAGFGVCGFRLKGSIR